MPRCRKCVKVYVVFLGLANSMRNGLDADFMRENYKLNPLTGVNTKLEITDSHRGMERIRTYSQT